MIEVRYWNVEQLKMSYKLNVTSIMAVLLELKDLLHLTDDEIKDTKDKAIDIGSCILESLAHYNEKDLSESDAVKVIVDKIISAILESKSENDKADLLVLETSSSFEQIDHFFRSKMTLLPSEIMQRL